MKNCFIIVNHNDYKSTKHLIDNIIDYKIIDEILIIDNNSKEEEKKKLATIKNAKIKIIYNESNGGYSQGINIGSKYFVNKYKKCNLIISNSDIIILSEEDLKKMIEMLSYENVGIVGPQILELGNIYKGCKSPSVIVDSLLNIPLINNFVRDNKLLYKNDYYESETSVVEVVNSCFFLITSEIMQKINYMDENVFLYYEDFILSKKIRNLGCMALICNKIKVKHLYSVSVDKVIKEYDKFKLLKRSQYYYHTTYNELNRAERYLLKSSIYISVFIRKIMCILKKSK